MSARTTVSAGICCDHRLIGRTGRLPRLNEILPCEFQLPPQENADAVGFALTYFEPLARVAKSRSPKIAISSPGSIHIIVQ